MNSTAGELRKEIVKRKIWMLSFESSAVAQLGGLGPAVANLSKALAKEFEVSVFMPSHGRHRDVRIREKLQLREFGGLIEGARKGVDGNFYPYKIGLEKGVLDGVNYFLVKGLDADTSRWLDDSQIYDGELTYQKMSLLARTMESHLNLTLKEKPESRPDVIHAHDWHTVPAAVLMKQICLSNRLNVPLVFTIHLLNGKTLPWHYISEEWCGVKDEQHNFSSGMEWKVARYREVWENISGSRFESFGAYESDLVTTVSNSYLEQDVLPSLGQSLNNKAGYIYNCCDWTEASITKAVKKRYSGQIRFTGSDRKKFRKYLLTKALVDVSTPQIEEIAVRETVESAFSNQFGSNSSATRPFTADGELVLMTGRLDTQKGVDVLLRAVPEVLDVVPTARFLFLLIPILHRELIEATIREAARFENNVRVVLGRVPDIYGLAHISADVYAMPSRWEPFGLTALEAMATGNPIAGTRVGGINETVLDVFDHFEKGTGHLVASEDHTDLARTLTSFLLMMEIGASKMSAQNMSHLIDKIPLEPIRELVARDHFVGSKIRENCRTRVRKQFGPRNTARMAVSAYERALEISSQRVTP